ncbi:MAG: DUF4003 family protein, partial [Lachnospiraceae bacterium]|nr:DUF4003 family protein [Lachnospiraceae bacterium]
SIAEGNAEEKCNKVVALYEALKADGVKYGKYHELVVLASLALLPVELSVLVEDIKAVDAFLTEQKGYGGFFGFDKKTRLMHAAMIVSCDYVKNDATDIAAMTGTLAAVAAQQAAMCACIAAATAASSAAASGN